MRTYFTSKNVVIILALVFSILIVRNKPNNILSWDVYGHYLYLPALFVNHDIKIQDFDKVEKNIEKYDNLSTFYVASDFGNGNKVIRYPVGFSILMAPFFLASHFFCSFTDYEQDGFSLPYQLGIVIGCLFYVLLGFFMLRKALLIWFEDYIVTILLILFSFGTNYFFMAVHNQGMVHGIMIVFYASLLYFTNEWHKNPNYKNSIFLGLTLGLMCLTRASEILAIFIPLLWNVNSKETLKIKFEFLKKHLKLLYILIGVFVLCGLPQLIYWRYTSGSWIIDSYNNPGEGFDLLSPHTLDYLFSYRKGWFLYTPIMLFAIIGLFIFRKKIKQSYTLIFFTIFNIYLLSSWTCWWYAESFGQRSIIQSYPIYLIGLGFLIHYTLEKKYLKYLFSPIFLFFIFLNLFQGWQMNRGIIDGSGMTRQAYWSAFLKTEPVSDFEDYLLIDNTKPVEYYVSQHDKFTKKILIEFSFEDKEYASDYYSTCCGSLIVKDNEYSKDIRVPYYELAKEPYAIIEFTGNFYIHKNINDIKPTLVFKILHNNQVYFERYLELEQFEEGKWIEASIQFICPFVRSKSDEIQVFAWKRGEGEFYVDDIVISKFERN